MRKKLLALIFLPAFLLILASPTYGFPFINPDLFKIKLPAGLFASPTPTPTPIPTTQPTTTPTETSTPTETPAPTLTPVAEVTGETSLQPSPTIISPTPTPTAKQWSQKDMIVYGVIGLLVLTLLFQSWPKIKKWLHEKTQ